MRAAQDRNELLHNHSIAPFLSLVPKDALFSFLWSSFCGLEMSMAGQEGVICGLWKLQQLLATLNMQILKQPWQSIVFTEI